MRGQAAIANRRPLDWLSFFLADVQGGIGPFLAIYLLGSRHWSPGEIGVVLTVGGIATVVARGPAGALVDAVKCKRTLITLAAAAIMATASVMALSPNFWPVAMPRR